MHTMTAKVAGSEYTGGRKGWCGTSAGHNQRLWGTLRQYQPLQCDCQSELKMGINCVSQCAISQADGSFAFVSEAANLQSEAALPYVGTSAFSHKAGYHVSGVTKWLDSYQHIDPAKVGNH